MIDHKGLIEGYMATLKIFIPHRRCLKDQKIRLEVARVNVILLPELDNIDVKNPRIEPKDQLHVVLLA